MMYELIIFVVLAFVTWRITRSSYNQFAHYLNAGLDNEAVTHESQLERLIAAAGRYYDERKWLAAEKAYVKVLKLDHKNTTAYRRLGMVYSQLKNYSDAAECFQIAMKSGGTAADWQNLATVQYHLRSHDEVEASLKKSIEIEPSVSRYLALAKAQGILDKNEEQRLTFYATQKFDTESPAIEKARAARSHTH